MMPSSTPRASNRKKENASRNAVEGLFGRMLRDPNRKSLIICNSKKITSTPNTPCGTAISLRLLRAKVATSKLRLPMASDL